MVLEAEEKSRKKRLKTVCWVLQPQEDFSNLGKTGLVEWQVDSKKKKKEEGKTVRGDHCLKKVK